MQVDPSGDVWKLQMTGTPALLPAAEAFPLLSSGLVGIIPSVYDAATGAGVVDSAHTMLSPGIATFQSCRAFIRTDATSDVNRSLATLEFDMRTATLTAEIDGGGDGLRLTHELRVLLHTPSVTMHTISVEATSDGVPVPLPIMKLEHEVRINAVHDDIAFEGVLLPAGDAQHFVSQAVSGGSCCVTAFRATTNLAPIGLPMHREPAVSGGGVRRAVTTLTLAPAASATSAQIHVFSCTLRCGDGDAGKRDALSSARRLLMGAVNTDPATVSRPV
jgi:hypothetical protein